MRIALMVCVSLALLAPASRAAEQLPPWPIDLAMLEYAQREEARLGPDAAAEFLRRARRIDLERVLSADVVVLGTVSSLGTVQTEAPRAVFTTIQVKVEDVLKGDPVLDVLEIRNLGATIDRQTYYGLDMLQPPYAGPLGDDPPETGKRYIFLADRAGGDGSVLVGGLPNMRYEIEEGVVVRKGWEVERFVALVRRYLQTRTPVHLYRSSDAVILGEVLEKAIRYRRPPTEGPKTGNYVLVRADEVATGEVACGEVLRVEMPYTAEWIGKDHPDVAEGKRFVMFLSRVDGRWTFHDGSSSALRVWPDGSFASYSNLQELVREAR